ncbi:TolC family protein [Photobacterium atrarenae]|uniref:TolC family protein n=1 Tax=Photobacterium atrarenae TaxID=865757 RepID=A0ABY5GK80_9GAMM|nr:TolC family protein [Photobacterium atrarenae]UTV29586.1 TolC family protein [Photobacterium atrarenae]
MNLKPTILAVAVSVGGVVASWPVAAADTPLASAAVQPSTLNQLIALALNNDAGRKQFDAQTNALRQMAFASATEMDPKLKLGFGNLPVDSFRFDEDLMTNLSIGLMQQFERGETLLLKQKQTHQKAESVQWQTALREREVVNQVTQLWLELGYQQAAAQILYENKRLMQEMENFIQTNYSLGKSEAQDLLQAQLQVSRLDDKLQANAQMQRRIQSQLSEWLGAAWLARPGALKASNQLDWHALEQRLLQTSGTAHYPLLRAHPSVQIADTAIAVNRTQVDLAEQAYAPQFGVEVMYAYRQADNMRGEPASDLLSAYLTLDIPLFTDNRQDRTRAAAQYQVGAAQSNKDLLLAQMNAKVNALLTDKSNLEQRLARYQNTLLAQAKARTQAVERGYQNNTAQFNDVITAASDELALALEQARLTTDLNLVSSNLAFFLGGDRATATQTSPHLFDRQSMIAGGTP